MFGINHLGKIAGRRLNRAAEKTLLHLFVWYRKNKDLTLSTKCWKHAFLLILFSSFVISLYKQYQERGSLSKKQLQGLHSKASKIKDLSPGKLATVEAIINKMPTRDKSALPEAKPMFEKDESTGEIIEEILAKYPQHKRVLFFKSKYENNEVLSGAEISELKRFKQVLK